MLKQIFLHLIVASLLYRAEAQPLKPVAEKAGALTITVDPRMELLCAVQSLADYPYVNRQSDYNKKLMQFFEKDSASEAVKLTQQLAKESGFVHDGPIDLILRLSEVPALKQTLPFTKRTIERAGSIENLDNYRVALKKFATRSQFARFWNNTLPYYQKIVEYTASDLAGYDPVKTIESYYNEPKKSYTVILSPSLMGGYGMRVTDRHNRMDIYGCLNTDQVKNGIPFYSKDGLSNYLYHEFSHSYVNPLTDNYLSAVNATSALFSPIRDEMTAGSYGSWITCINEHIVRAVHIRILQSTGEEKAADNLLEMEKSRRFVYIGPILNKLKQFEYERDNRKITFTEFYPELMAVFDSLSRSDNNDLTDPLFTGPVQTVLGKQKVVLIYPTRDNDTTALKNVFNYTSNIQKMKGDAAVLFPDTTALITDLSDKWLIAYGTVESNLFLKMHSGLFPFRITGDTISTNQKFVGENLRLITCLPNPQNRRRGLLVNTATHNRNIRGVMIPVKADYLVFEEIDNLLQYGEYNKGESQWKYTPGLNQVSK